MGIPKRGLQNLIFLIFSAEHVKWWSTNSPLPHLKQIALKYLCISATSASSEWCFSSADLTVSELRTQLSGERLKALNVMPCYKVLL